MKVSLIYAYWLNQPDGITWCDLPWALRDKGLPKRLHADGHEVVETMLMAEEPDPDSLRAGLKLARDVSEAVGQAVNEGELPVILAGSCALAAIGASAALGSDTAIAWFDAHADLNTPETTTSGLFEGMALAAATGQAWRTMAETHAGLHAPPSLAGVTMFGVRDIDPPEQALIAAHRIPLVDNADQLSARLSGSGRTYVHLDMDVHDARSIRTSPYAAEGGPGVDTVRAALTAIAKPDCLAITGLDPAAPDGGEAADIAIGHVLAVCNNQS